jgi:hypothetical protein
MANCLTAVRMSLGKGFQGSYTIIQFHVKTLEEASQQMIPVSLIGAKRRLSKDM